MGELFGTAHTTGEGGSRFKTAQTTSQPLSPTTQTPRQPSLWTTQTPGQPEDYDSQFTAPWFSYEDFGGMQTYLLTQQTQRKLQLVQLPPYIYNMLNFDMNPTNSGSNVGFARYYEAVYISPMTSAMSEVTPSTTSSSGTTGDAVLSPKSMVTEGVAEVDEDQTQQIDSNPSTQLADAVSSLSQSINLTQQQLVIATGSVSGRVKDVVFDIIANHHAENGQNVKNQPNHHAQNVKKTQNKPNRQHDYHSQNQPLHQPTYHAQTQPLHHPTSDRDQAKSRNMTPQHELVAQLRGMRDETDGDVEVITEKVNQLIELWSAKSNLLNSNTTRLFPLTTNGEAISIHVATRPQRNTRAPHQTTHHFQPQSSQIFFATQATPPQTTRTMPFVLTLITGRAFSSNYQLPNSITLTPSTASASALNTQRLSSQLSQMVLSDQLLQPVSYVDLPAYFSNYQSTTTLLRTDTQFHQSYTNASISPPTPSLTWYDINSYNNNLGTKCLHTINNTWEPCPAVSNIFSSY